MFKTTKLLVTGPGRYVAPVVLSAAVAVGAVALINHTGVHAAAGNGAAPLDENSVSALTSLDSAMEAVAARVTPAVVNIAVTSTPSAEETQQQQGGDDDDAQGLPPGLQQFFGQGGGRRMQPQQQQQLQRMQMLIQPRHLRHVDAVFVLIYASHRLTALRVCRAA